MTGGRLKGVSKRFSRRGPWILDQVDLEMSPGSCTLVVGGNGSGKSTLLRVAAGVTHPTAGTVVAPKTIGYVPERLAARSNLTGSEYVTHMGRVRRLDSEILDARCQELFERLDLQPGPTVMIDSLSKGNKQKLILAQAFLGPVGLLVLDEPFNGLDRTAHRGLSELVAEARANGTSILMSAHHADPTIYADDTVNIGDGRLERLTDAVPATAVLDADEQTIELAATSDARGYGQLAALLGVRHIRHDVLDRTVSLVVEQVHTNAVLSAAIGMGWSVQSVGAPGQEENRR